MRNGERERIHRGKACEGGDLAIGLPEQDYILGASGGEASQPGCHGDGRCQSKKRTAEHKVLQSWSTEGRKNG